MEAEAATESVAQPNYDVQKDDNKHTEVKKMTDLIKGALYVIAAGVLGQGIMKDKILAEKNVRNVAIGGLAGALFGDKLEDILTKELTPEQKKRLVGSLAGAGLGAYIGSKIGDGALDSVGDKIKSYVGKKDAAPQDYNSQK